jgi:hypothetical protein
VAAMVAASSAHIQAVFTWGYPEGATPSLPSQKMFSTVSVPVPLHHGGRK